MSRGAAEEWQMGGLRRVVLLVSSVAMAAALGACAQGGGEEAGDAPHALGSTWFVSSPTFHGAAYAANPAECEKCHSPTSEFCSKCHFGPGGSRVPQGSGWVHGQVPHDALESDGGVCNSCHRLLRRYQAGPDACHDCHVQGQNHPLGQPWLDKTSPDFHGIEASQSVEACKACHGQDLRGGSVGVSCYTCHFSPTGSRSPAGSGWRHGRSGHTSFGSRSAVCNKCHSVNRTYGNGPGSCHNCHGDD